MNQSKEETDWTQFLSGVPAAGTLTGFLHKNASGFDRVIFNVFKDLDRQLYEETLNF